MVVPMMIAIVKALLRRNDAAQDQADQSHQEAALGYTVCIYHGRSYAVCPLKLTHDTSARSRLISDNVRVYYSYKVISSRCGHSHTTAAPPPVRVST